MKKTVLTYGLIAGLVVSFWWMLIAAGMIEMNAMTNEYGMLIGYTMMLIAFSFIFVAVKRYRQDNGNEITFGKAFKIGMYITLIASTMYVITWLVDYYYFIPDFFDQMGAQAIEKLKSGGASQAKIQATALEMAKYKKMYDNPLINALFTYAEIIPVGLLVSLIIAAILKKKPKNVMTT